MNLPHEAQERLPGFRREHRARPADYHRRWVPAALHRDPEAVRAEREEAARKVRYTNTDFKKPVPGRNWDLTRAVELYNTGLSQVEVGKILGVDPRSIGRGLKHAGVPIRKPGAR